MNYNYHKLFLKKIKSKIDFLFSNKKAQLVFCGLFSILTSLIITLFILQRYYTNLEDDWALSLFSSWILNFSENRIFLFSWLIIFLVQAFFLAITRSLIIASGLLGISSVILLFVNQVKMASRGVPLLPEDFSLINEARQVSSLITTQDWLFLGYYLSLIIIPLAAGFMIKKLITKYPKNNSITALRISTIVILIAIGSLCKISYSFKDTAVEKTNKNLIQNPFIPWNQSMNYLWNSPINGFFYNVGKIQLTKPSNYSKKSITNIVKKYQKQAEIINQKRQSMSNSSINLVVILSESLVDPLEFNDYYQMKKDPMPFTRQLMKKSTNGTLVVSEYGGGTANVEFELLTGLSNALNEKTTPFTHFLPKISNFPSIASLAKEAGYSTTAIHNFLGMMYKRNLTYPNLGIDEFYDINKFQQLSSVENDPYDSDESFFRELLVHLKKQPGKTKFIGGTTMQNHSPYLNKYQLNNEFIDQVANNLTEEEYQKIESYSKGLAYSDEALKNFMDELNQLPDKTAVIYYGDHLPGTDVFKRVADKDEELSHQTPVMIFTNFDAPTKQLGLISGNYIFTTFFDLFNFKISPFQALLKEIQADYPKFNLFHIEDHEKLEKNKTYQEYRQIQYDLLNGKGYAQAQDFFKVN